jgi:hypothetical protein
MYFHIPTFFLLSRAYRYRALLIEAGQNTYSSAIVPYDTAMSEIGFQLLQHLKE